MAHSTKAPRASYDDRLIGRTIMEVMLCDFKHSQYKRQVLLRLDNGIVVIIPKEGFGGYTAVSIMDVDDVIDVIENCVNEPEAIIRLYRRAAESAGYKKTTTNQKIR